MASNPFFSSPKLTEPLMPERESFQFFVRFVIRRAKSLLPAKGVTSNVWCECSLIRHSNTKLMVRNTKVIKATLNPIWNMYIDFGVAPSEEDYSLRFHLKHAGFLSHKDLGEVVIPLTDVLDKADDEGPGIWYLVQPTRGTASIANKSPDRYLGELMIHFRLSEPMPSQVEHGRKMFADVISAQKSLEMSHDRDSELRILKDCHSSKPRPGEVWMAVEIDWILSWLSFTTSTDSNPIPPGPIANLLLLEDELSKSGELQIRSNLSLKTHYRLVNIESWKLLQSWYGGGPAIKIEIPSNIETVESWLASVNLAKTAKICTTSY